MLVGRRSALRGVHGATARMTVGKASRLSVDGARRPLSSRAMRNLLVVLAALVVVAPPAIAADAAVAEDALGCRLPEVCPTDCLQAPCYTLVLRYTINEAAIGQPAFYVTHETFTGENYPSLEAAHCGARKIRREGYVIPTGQYPNAGNVMPETITPMPVL